MWRLKDARENGGGRMKLSGGRTGMWGSRRHPDADSPQVTFHVAIYVQQNINQSHWGNVINLNSTISLVLWFGLHITYSLLSFVFTAHIHVTRRNKWIMFCGIICHDLFNLIRINRHLGYFQSLDINTKYLSTYVFVKCIWRVSFLRLSCWVSGYIPLKYQ